MRPSARPFPTLSLFVVYSAHALQNGQRRAGQERGDDGDGDDDDDEGDDDDDHKDENEDDDEADARVVYLTAGQASKPADRPALTRDRRARLLGTVFGLQDFVKLVSHSVWVYTIQETDFIIILQND